MDSTELKEILTLHHKWLNNENGGVRADLSCADLSCADLRCADLRFADLRCADLRCADLGGADLGSADLGDADLHSADLSCADLSCADLSCADLSGADLSEAAGLLSAIDFILANFERAEQGYIAYKTFGGSYAPPESWDIIEGGTITENVNHDRAHYASCGINVATLDYAKRNAKGRDIWKVLIEWPWLAGVCVPYNTDGIMRCERVRLLEVVGTGP